MFFFMYTINYMYIHVHLLLVSMKCLLFLPSDISVLNASISQIIVAKDITQFLVWVPADSSGKSTTLHLRQTSDSREGQFVHPTEMTIHVVPGECTSELSECIS